MFMAEKIAARGGEGSRGPTCAIGSKNMGTPPREIRPPVQGEKTKEGDGGDDEIAGVGSVITKGKVSP